jgi:hypothetical protein
MLKCYYSFFVCNKITSLALIINSLKFIIMKKVLLSLALVTLSLGAYAQYSWTPQGTKLATSFGVNELSIVDANTVWLTAYDGSGAGTYPKVISKTMDGGTTWTASTVVGPIAAALVGDIAALDANTAFIVTAPVSGTAANGIWKTANGGSSWTKQTAYSSASFANVIHFWDANEGFSAGDPTGTGASAKFEILRTTNGGATWTAVASAPAPVGGIEYGLTGVKYVVGNNIWLGTTKGRILRSSDRGVTWTANSTPALDFGGGATGGGVDGSSAKMAFKDATNGLLIAVDNEIDAVLYGTTDGGATWEPIDANGTWFFGDLAHVPGTQNTYVSTGVNSDAAQGTGSSFTADGGLNWTIIDNIPGTEGGQRGKVNFLNNTTGWAGFFSDGATGSEGILKFVGTLPTSPLAVNEASAKSNLKVYPNPAVDVVNITANKEIKSVTIYDLSGKKVKSSTDAATINVSSLAKGTYIVQAYYGNGSVENTKLIKK